MSKELGTTINEYKYQMGVIRTTNIKNAQTKKLKQNMWNNRAIVTVQPQKEYAAGDIG